MTECAPPLVPPSPATKSLIFAWGALMALSAILGLAAETVGSAKYAAVWPCVIACVAAAKSRIVLAAYLGLGRAPGALAGFFSALAGLLALIAFSILIFPTPAPRHAARAQGKISLSIAGANE